MKIDINRIAAYLAGNFPPYYEQYPKIKFMKVLLREASGIFPEKEEFDFIDKHSSSLQVFFKESLSLVENEKTLQSIIIELKIPFEAQGQYIEPQKIKKEISEENKKTIGFITPFDKEGEYLKLKDFIQSILAELGFHDWKIEVSSFDVGAEKQTLWLSVEDFLNRYPLYIANFRDQNLNVALEVGYLKGRDIDLIQIKNEGEKVSDLDGFIYVGSKDTKSKPWIDSDDAKGGHEKNQKKFKEDLSIQLKRYLG